MSFAIPGLYAKKIMKMSPRALRKIEALPKYRHPADLLNLPLRPIHLQKQQIEGRLLTEKLGDQETTHEKLVSELIKTRNSYRQEIDPQRLQAMAQSEYNCWGQYLSHQVANLPETEKIEESKRQKLYESYLIAKQRNQQRIQMSRVVILLNELQKGYRFDINLHPMVIIKMVHPHYGYLNLYTRTKLPFRQFCTFMEEMIVVSQIWDQGSNLHADQLMSYVFWKLYSPTPTVNLDSFCTLLSQFKFNVTPENVQEYFAYHLQNRQGEIKNQMVRFDFWRNLFLERGL